MHLYLKLKGSLSDIARKVSGVALHGWRSEKRYGLNLGGGEYFEFKRSGAEVILVCNDRDHADVYIEERSQFPFYFHWREGGDEVLAEIGAKLSGVGISNEMHEDT